jgi:hypothetical protein
VIEIWNTKNIQQHKRKTNKKKVEPLNEFRTHKEKDKHIHYVFGKRGNSFHSIVLTHSAETKATRDTPASKNIPLKHNPNQTNEQSYARPFYIKRHKDKYSECRSGWAIHEDDKPTIEKIKKRAEPARNIGGMERQSQSITGHTRHTKSIIRKKKNKVNKKRKQE